MVGYCKLCSLEDFRAPEVRDLMRQAWSETAARDPEWPEGREDRKCWEVAQTCRGLRDHGAVHPGSEVLGVGAGAEQTIFWLTNHVRSVHATDLYAADTAWGEQCPVTMLSDPGRHAAGPWNPRRLVVQHMSALELRYEDAHFDGLFSCSSLEHFGTPAEIAAACREMCRVLKPGGVAAVTTEFRVEGPPGFPGTVLFDADELEATVVDAAEWALAEPLDLRLTDATRASAVAMASAIEDVEAHRNWSHYPHLVLTHEGRMWTSLSLVLRKPGRSRRWRFLSRDQARSLQGHG